MPSADLFLRLLEEKDLVSAEVLQAAWREVQRSSPPPDAVRLSLWLVQGQHLTAAQADRLLSATPKKRRLPSRSRRCRRPSTQKSAARKPDVHTGPAGKPDVREDDLELAPMTEQEEGKAAKSRPAKPSPAPPTGSDTASPRAAAPRAGPGQEKSARPRSVANWNRWKIR